MLELDRRRLLLEALKPPTGYEFDRGIGTTFTLDLTALLIAPLSLALLDHGDEAESLADPLLLLESLRRFSDRITIFCQAGRISIPRKFNHLYHYLENQVVEVQAPLGGVFHPKVWVLRYLAEDGPVLYRLLVMTRNLTFDKSWDLMVQMDGKLVDRKVAFGRNNPLGDFFQALPELAIKSFPDPIKQAVENIQDEVRRVDFQTPPNFNSEYKFHPMGIPGYQRGFLFDRDYFRAMVVSPFLQDEALQRIADNGKDHVLISETEMLDSIRPAALAKYSQVFGLDSSIWDTEQVDQTSEEKLAPPAGLHAKLFIVHHGWDSTWLVGSANATRPGLFGFTRRNVEFMLELTGKRSKVGIESVLGDAENDMSIRNLLRTYQEPETVEASDPDQIGSERLADRVRQWLVESLCSIELYAGDQEDTFHATIKPTQKLPPPEGTYSIQCWPVSLPETHSTVLDVENPDIRFKSLSILALTPFIGFSINAQIGEAKHNTQFVLQLPMVGLPANREDHLIRAVISDQTQFLRFLRLILAMDPSELWRDALWENTGDISPDEGPQGGIDMPLLEDLLRAFSRTPEKIGRIDQIVQRLLATDEGRAVLPEGFETLWIQFIQAKGEGK
jgi:hypothetical protein